MSKHLTRRGMGDNRETRKIEAKAKKQVKWQ
jgi:hypothetical protein